MHGYLKILSVENRWTELHTIGRSLTSIANYKIIGF